MADTMNDTVADVAVIEKTALAPPRMWNVILFNDDHTSMEFVISILMQVFHKSYEDAYSIMEHIHNNGKGVAGTYSNEIALTKKEDTISYAKANGFPLVADIEVAD
jgi:ATP-dependent Clp protease adaptor protein ClpS